MVGDNEMFFFGGGIDNREGVLFLFGNFFKSGKVFGGYGKNILFLRFVILNFYGGYRGVVNEDILDFKNGI